MITVLISLFIIDLVYILSFNNMQSLNGVYVNGRLLTPDVPYTLQEGDMVQLGVPTSPGVPAEFLYKFHSSLKVNILFIFIRLYKL